MAIPRTRPYRGPALFSYGLRPLFLLGTLQALVAMLYGYIGAVIGGDLLTTLPPGPGAPRRAAWRGSRARLRSESTPRWRSR